MGKDITNKNFDDLDRSDFTDEEFQNLVDYVKLLFDLNKKYQVVKFENDHTTNEPLDAVK